jgi:hypothetical protein
MAHHSQCCMFPIKLFCPRSSNLSIYHHEPIQISPRRVLKKDPTVSNKAAINLAIAGLVATRNVRHADGCKRLSKSSDLYKHVIALLHLIGVKITYDALMKRVSRVLVEKNITEIRLTNTSESSVVSSLSPHRQAENLLTSENTAKKTSHDNQSHKTPELKSSAGGWPKGSSKAKKKQDKENEYTCIDSIVLEYSIKHNASTSVEGKVEYGYLKRLIDEKKKEFGIDTAKKKDEKTSKQRALNSKLVSAVAALRAKWGHEKTHFFQQCNKNECGAYLQYKKQPNYKAMPKDLLGQKQHSVEWIGWPSPTSSPYQSDKEENYDADAVEGLLGIANTDLISMDRLEEVEDEGGYSQG